MSSASAAPPDTVNDEGARKAREAEIVAARLKRFRLARRLSLRRLGEMTGTSASFLSQLERGRSGASPSTLVQIAVALGIGVADLFEEGVDGHHVVLRRHQRPALPESGGCRKTLVSQRPMHEFEVYIGEFDVGGSTGDESYSHGGTHEMLVVLRGKVEVNLDAATYILEEGDSIEYAPSTAHRTANVGDTRAEVMWIIAPATSAADDLNRYVAGKALAPGRRE
ncbi:helix-turn-helix transcriptional regulator [Rhizobiales bacterium Sp-1]|uniref:Helix-turn-helix transcriptional regulator n=1 Tax=Segnochrobactrum spirostomi TaxID=2608987 RepID=A0A6A7Y953_9HYPH|nr:helix-turn-helix transcriptional regulator [Segnochrobactrum spirostomi]